MSVSGERGRRGRPPTAAHVANVGGGPYKGARPPAYVGAPPEDQVEEIPPTSSTPLVVPCRPADPASPDELPGGARRLAEKPGDGWTATATFAAGVVETKRGDGDPVAMHSTAVRLRHVAGHRAVAWWTNGKPDAGAYRPAGWPWWQPCGVADVARVVKLANPPRRKRGEAAPVDPFEVELVEPEPEP